MRKITLSPNYQLYIVLKLCKDTEFTISEGKEFHLYMDLRKKENYKCPC